MSTVDLSTYKELYLKTSLTQLHKLEEGITLLSTDATSKDGLDAVYINAHTLVSKSMLMGYKQVGILAHHIEKIFYAVKQEKFHVSSEFLVTLTSAVTALHNALDSIKTNNSEGDLSTQIQELQKLFAENTSV